MKKLTLLLVLAPLIVLGQNVPGYLGKRFIISYDLQPTYALSDSYLTSEDATKEERSMDFKNALDIEMVISKRGSLVFGVDYFSTYIKEDISGTTIVDNKTIPLFSLKNSKVRSTGFSFGYKSYTKHLAPLGLNYDYRLVYRRSSIEDLQLNVDSPIVSTSGTNQFGIRVGYYLNRMITDQIMITFGMNLSFIYLGDAEADSFRLDHYEPYLLSDGLALEGVRAVSSHEIFHLKLGIGYLF